jgi:hypothetical protein
LDSAGLLFHSRFLRMQLLEQALSGWLRIDDE